MAVPLTHIHSAGKAAEYAAHGAADYVAEGGRAQSAWLGRGAALLGLVGEVDPQQLQGLFLGKSADGKNQLLKRPRDVVTKKNKVRHAKLGWEFVTNPPKSVSVVSIEDERVEAAVFEASKAAVQQLDDVAMLADQANGRKGRKGLKRGSGIAAAVFLHRLGRAVEAGGDRDPQVHCHIHIPNLVWDGSSEKWRTIAAHNLFFERAKVDQIFLNELAVRLRALGYQLEASDHNFEIVGVRPEILDHFSVRSKATKESIKNRTKQALVERTESNRERALADALCARGWNLVPTTVRRVQQSTGKGGAPAFRKDGSPKTHLARVSGWIAEMADGRRIVDATNAQSTDLPKLTTEERSLLDQLRRGIWSDASLEVKQLTKAERAALRNVAFSAGRVDKEAASDITPRERLARLDAPLRDSVYSTVQWAKAASERAAEEAARDAAAPNIVPTVEVVSSPKPSVTARNDTKPANAPNDLLKAASEPSKGPQPLSRKVTGIVAAPHELRAAAAWAIKDVFERSSTAQMDVLIDAASKRSPGCGTRDQIRAALCEHHELIVRQVKEQGRQTEVATTLEVLNEETQLLHQVAASRDVVFPLGLPTSPELLKRLQPGEHVLEIEAQCARIESKHTPSPEEKQQLHQLKARLRDLGAVSREQRAAVNDLLTSPDRLLAWRGLPGTGKTTTLRLAEQCLREKGYSILACAPSSSASRERLRQAGFQNADTLTSLLLDAETGGRKFQIHSKTVIVLDEAGLASAKDVTSLLKLAERKRARVLLLGDDRQLTPVARGDAFRLLLKYGVRVSELNDIRRQDKNADYKRAVELLATGRTKDGMSALQKMGAVSQVASTEDRYQRLATDYLASRTDGRSVIAVCATHREVDASNSAIRSELIKAGQIDASQTLEYDELKSLGFTMERRRDWRYYQPGQVVEFHTRQGRLWKATTRWQVVSASEENGVVVRSADPDGSPVERKLRLTDSYVESFDVFARQAREIAVGDDIRWTGKTKTVAGEQLDNGKRHRVTAIDRARHEITLDDGEVVRLGACARLALGYASTTYAAQGRDELEVLWAQDAQSSRGSGSLQQALVAASRGQISIKIYTDNLRAMTHGLAKTSHRLSAMELMERAVHIQAREPLTQTHAPTPVAQLKEIAPATTLQPEQPSHEREALGY